MGENVTDENLFTLVASLAPKTLASDADFGDEHVRWQVYKYALQGKGSALETLLKIVSIETDSPVAIGIVLEIIENEIDNPDRWIKALPPNDRRLPLVRARETKIMRSLMRGEITQFDVDDWSDWLQRKIASTPNVPTFVLSR